MVGTVATAITRTARGINVSLLGAPGSGKGSYGRLLSKSLLLPLVTVSDVLRQDHATLLHSGQLVDDETVSDILQQHLMTKNDGYILDGFPRTKMQIELMELKWPSSIRLDAAIWLNVPKQVCIEKILGRRHCTKCGKNFNTAHVKHGDFDLPAQLPSNPECRRKEDGSLSCCKHWTTRPDDTPDLVHRRLNTYEAHVKPLIEYFRDRDRLLSFTPTRGYDDMPRFELAIHKWLQEWNNSS